VGTGSRRLRSDLPELIGFPSRNPVSLRVSFAFNMKRVDPDDSGAYDEEAEFDEPESLEAGLAVQKHDWRAGPVALLHIGQLQPAGEVG